jgi:hypothetical protein
MNPMLLLFCVTLALLYFTFNPNVLFRAGIGLGHAVGRLLTLQDGLLAQRVNRSDPEKLFITVFQSYSTAAGANGQAYIWDFGTDKDGLGVTRPTARATNGGIAAAGILAEAVAAGGYGLMQVYGYHSAVRARTVTGGTPAIAAGRPLIISVAGAVFCLESISTASKTIVSWPCGFAFGATTGFTTAAIAAFIKAL